MSDNPEKMRPIPDGGLKDAMPSWLKRPPAWRELPKVEEHHHERAMPEPDTSEIDPHALVDVEDLPQWLQSIAARGKTVDVPTISQEPEPEVIGTESFPAQEPAAPVEPEPDSAEEIEQEATYPTTTEPVGTIPWIPIAVALILAVALLVYLLTMVI